MLLDKLCYSLNNWTCFAAQELLNVIHSNVGAAAFLW